LAPDSSASVLALSYTVDSATAGTVVEVEILSPLARSARVRTLFGCSTYAVRWRA